MNFFKKHSKSFTIIELIIAVSIIIILSVIVIANYEWGGYELQLKESTQKVLQDMSRLREEAMFSSIENPPSGIYIGVSTSSYTIFRDLNSNYMYDDGEQQEVVDIGENIIFQSTGCDDTTPDSCPPTGPPGAVNLCFVPPEPRVEIFYGGVKKPAVMVTIWSKKSDSTTSIFITETGLIEER